MPLANKNPNELDVRVYNVITNALGDKAAQLFGDHYTNPSGYWHVNPDALCRLNIFFRYIFLLKVPDDVNTAEIRDCFEDHIDHDEWLRNFQRYILPICRSHIWGVKK